VRSQQSFMAFVDKAVQDTAEAPIRPAVGVAARFGQLGLLSSGLENAEALLRVWQ